ncbi:MAG TPA: tRNA (adenosine(37)-N6)-threonylcarbamoyltransferase complex dimerization subunit type 1 TsaB [Galbitalea sp.]|nr:tRNA (adenosine(37)-N6)-threonylcarbamoyltransferase complex dimerization subunit type 1 TsaB [Galbitalea sp.]
MLLAIDTSAGTSVAVVDGERGILAEQNESDTRRHAEVIGILIESALAQAAVPVTALSGVAVGMGPGPFTGLRVGIAAARAFALGIDRPTFSVVSHDAVAFGLASPTLVVTDARRREVYWSAYRGIDDAGLPRRSAGPGLTPPGGLRDAVDDFEGYARLDAEQISAGALGMVAELILLRGRPLATDTALYLRSPDVTLSAGPKRVS